MHLPANLSFQYVKYPPHGGAAGFREPLRFSCQLFRRLSLIATSKKGSDKVVLPYMLFRCCSTYIYLHVGRSMASFNTPCAVALGVVKGKVVYLEVESGKRVEEHIGINVDSAEPNVSGDFLSGHVAVASFATTIVKGVALARDAYVLDADGLRPLQRRAVTISSIKAKEYGAWEQIWNKPIFLSNSSPTVAIGASRAGSLLHINAVPSDVELAKKIWAVARILQRGGGLSLNCTCRLGLMPYEVFVSRGNRYLVAKFYLNASSPRSKSVFFIVGEGGNVVKRAEVGIDEAEAAAYEYIKLL